MIWVVGARGMLGSEVVRLLRAGGVPHTATGRDVDIRSGTAIRDHLRSVGFGRSDWIVNCAAYTAVDRAEEEPEEAARVNAAGALNLAVAAEETGAMLLHVSTDYVFSICPPGGCSEEDTPGPLNVYGSTKLAGEHRIRHATSRHVIIRTGWLYGAGGRNFVDAMRCNFKARDRIALVNDQRGCPTWARDLAEAIVLVTSFGTALFGTYHFTNGGTASWFELAQAAYSFDLAMGATPARVVLKPVPRIAFPTRATRPANSALRTWRFTEAFGVRPRGWREALRAYMCNETGAA